MREPPQACHLPLSPSPPLDEELLIEISGSISLLTKLFSPPAELGRPPPAGRQSPKGGPVYPPGDIIIKIPFFMEVKTTVRCDNYQDNYMWDTSRNRKGPIFMDQPPEEPEVQPGSEMRSTFSFYLNWQLLQSIVMRFNKIPVQNILLNVISSSCWQIT